MRLLAIDTALEACSVGVISADGASPILVSEVIGKGHAERLMPMIEAAMAAAGLAFADLDRIAVTVGPGSFTGVRIGIAAARGLALVTGCALVGIGTLAVLAESARAIAGAQPVLAALDARRNEIYGQLFASDGTAITEPQADTAVMFASLVPADMLLAGSGAAAVAAAIGPGAEARIMHRSAFPDIAAVLRMGRAAPPAETPPRPLYLRPPDAKPQSAASLARR
jgi:tRNA threonylcarbamoyladenosine biosynthesis protein TsaB